MTSVRRRLLMGTAAATVTIFVAAALTLYVLARQFLLAEFDATLRAKVAILASMTEYDVREQRIDADDALLIPEYRARTNPEYFQIASDDGQHVLLSPSLGQRRMDFASSEGQSGKIVADFVALPDGRRGRAMSFRARTQPDERIPSAAGPDITITVAKSTETLDRPLERLRMLLLAVCGLATVTLLGLSAWIIRRGLHPLRKLAQRIAPIGAQDLGTRLDIRDAPNELIPIVARLNDLLARLEAAFQREKCFTDDAAHELRTPLAGIAAALEVCARQRRDAAEYETVIHNCLKVVERMNSMIDNLLLLARADADRLAIVRAPVELVDLTRELWARFVPLANDRRLRVAWDTPDSLTFHTDGEKLANILSNLLENAVHYADDGGQICLTLRDDADRVRITVANSGNRVDPADAERLFDRFWRGDSARAGSGRHCGLGLSVCRKLATALGATIWVECANGGLFIARVELPHVTAAGLDGQSGQEGTYPRKPIAAAGLEPATQGL